MNKNLRDSLLTLDMAVPYTFLTYKEIPVKERAILACFLIWLVGVFLCRCISPELKPAKDAV